MNRRPLLNILFLFLVLNNKNSYSQNSFIIEAAIPVLVPKENSFSLSREPKFSHDKSYTLTVHPKIGVGLMTAIGYEISVKNSTSWHLNLPIMLRYRFMNERNEQEGEYANGSSKYFNGVTKFKSYLNIVSISSGLNYYTKNHKYMIEVLGSINTVIYTTSLLKEEPINCVYCSSGNSKISYSDVNFYGSIDLKLAKVFSYNKIQLCPFLSYNINFFYKKPYERFSFDYKLNNPLYNLTSFYYFIEPGLKIKI